MIMNWFLDVIKNKYAIFTGRARRQEYWMFVLVYAIIAIALQLLAVIFGLFSGLLATLISVIFMLFALAVLIPSLAVVIRRLHDIGKSGWWILISLIPLIGEIWLIILLATDSQPGENQYGPNPKGL